MVRSHIMPKFYLKHFQSNTGHIFNYSRQQGNFVTGPENISVEKDFYSEDTELLLSTKIEGPASDSIRKILNRSELDENARLSFVDFVLNLEKRGPSGKQRIIDLMPTGKREVAYKVKREISDEIKKNPKRETELLDVKERMINAIKEISADEIWGITFDPEHAPRARAIILKMHWIFLVSDSSQFFVTSDNPVFILRRDDVLSISAELSFPISKNMTFLATWNKSESGLYKKVGLPIIKKINRRTIVSAIENVYSPSGYNWIPRVLVKRRLEYRNIKV